ncbi:MAG: tRNA uridine-5-carboxymethylaminomethyl(34) synthesis GTPase MnmE [Desulfomonilaceae bacterium]
MTELFTITADTIAALSTAPGYSGIGVIRISGPDSIPIIDQVFKPASADGNKFPDRKAIYGRFVSPHGGNTLDDGVVIVMRGPNSYTGEDVVEISLHGSPVILDQALKTILTNGARLATRGEFTRRAFLNSRLDLVQAEAVIDLIMASTPSAVEEARSRLDSKLSHEVQSIVGTLTDIIAELEADIEFAEDMETVPSLPQSALMGIQTKMRRLLQSADSGRYRSEGLRVAIVGKPNVGKSTLFNALLGEERMIATPHPGTTRDAVSETVVIKGISFVICDTAGLRENPEPVEEEGIKRTLNWIERSDLVLLLMDVSVPMDDYDQWAYDACKDAKKMLVFNKTDLPAASIRPGPYVEPDSTVMYVSAKTGVGIDSLMDALFEQGSAILSSSEYSLGCGLNQRGVALVGAASRKIEAILETISTGHNPGPEILSLELTGALRDLMQITGDSIDEAVLDRIFERFCVGK